MSRIDGGIEIPEGATHMITVCDTFSYEDYIVFAFGEEDLAEKRIKYNKNMQRMGEVIKLKQDAKCVIPELGGKNNGNE